MFSQLLIFFGSFGVCCIFVISTGMTTISQNCTYIQNENFPQALPNTNAVQFTVQKCADGTLKKERESYCLVASQLIVFSH